MKEAAAKIHHDRRRSLGEHLTSVDIFKKFVLPQVKNRLYDHTWVDLYCGEGNLVLPILDEVPRSKRILFFKEHIFLFDVQKRMVERSIDNAEKYGIPRQIASKNIKHQDTLKRYPRSIKQAKYPVFHITNPPYLYIGYIVKHSDSKTKTALSYFQNENEGLQDLYQIGLMNDLRHGIDNMIYIIPSNFIFGYSVSNYFRKQFLPFYSIGEAYIFEKKMFDFTGTNVCICHFKKNPHKTRKAVKFEATKFNDKKHKRKYSLKPEYDYRAGSEFEEFAEYFRSTSPLKVEYYLTQEEVHDNHGTSSLEVIDSNRYENNKYFNLSIKVNKKLYDRIKNNPLFVRTVDTGSIEGRIGLFYIKDIYGADGVLVTKAKYRTHPIQVFTGDTLSAKDTELLKNYFNCVLEYFREEIDSEFLTTYKYSDSTYIRKYMGLSQAKRLIETFPINTIDPAEKKEFRTLVGNTDVKGLFSFLKKINKGSAYQETLL